MKKVTPCIFFQGNAADAIKFYKSIFKKFKVTEQHKRDGKLLYGAFEIFGQDFMFISQKMSYKLNHSFSVFVSCRDQAEVDYYWTKLTKGGRESQCGWLIDKFGLSWQIIPVALSQLMERGNKKQGERVFQAMLKMRKIDVATLKRAYAGK